MANFQAIACVNGHATLGFTGVTFPLLSSSANTSSKQRLLLSLHLYVSFSVSITVFGTLKSPYRKILGFFYPFVPEQPNLGDGEEAKIRRDAAGRGGSDHVHLLLQRCEFSLAALHAVHEPAAAFLPSR